MLPLHGSQSSLLGFGCVPAGHCSHTRPSGPCSPAAHGEHQTENLLNEQEVPTGQGGFCVSSHVSTRSMRAVIGVMLTVCCTSNGKMRVFTSRSSSLPLRYIALPPSSGSELWLFVTVHLVMWTFESSARIDPPPLLRLSHLSNPESEMVRVDPPET